ncbi:MAG TPA: DUF1080 domain-containing protein, partial [Puia sp.]|nr:DUF1080 domain-containing protein [Puia sp.]
MKRIACLTVALALLTMNLCAQTENQLSAQEKSDGWKLLFDGSTTNGWHTYGKKTAGSAWKSDGSLHLDAS